MSNTNRKLRLLLQSQKYLSNRFLRHLFLSPGLNFSLKMKNCQRNTCSGKIVSEMADVTRIASEGMHMHDFVTATRHQKNSIS